MILDWLFGGDDAFTHEQRLRLDNALCTWRAGLAHAIGMSYRADGLEALAGHATTAPVRAFWHDEHPYGGWGSYAAETLVQAGEMAGLHDVTYPTAARLEILPFAFDDRAADAERLDRVVLLAHYGGVVDWVEQPAEALAGAAREMRAEPMRESMDRAWGLIDGGTPIPEACREAGLVTERVPAIDDEHAGSAPSEHAEWCQARARELGGELPTRPGFDPEAWAWSGEIGDGGDAPDVAFYRTLAACDDELSSGDTSLDELADATSEAFASRFERRVLQDRADASLSFDERLLRHCSKVGLPYTRPAAELAEIATVATCLLDEAD